MLNDCSVPGPKPFWSVGEALDVPEICVTALKSGVMAWPVAAPSVGVSVIDPVIVVCLPLVSKEIVPEPAAPASPEALQFQVLAAVARVKLAVTVCGSPRLS